MQPRTQHQSVRYYFSWHYSLIALLGSFHHAEYPTQEASTETTQNDAGNGNIAAQTFTFRELALATKNFRPECLLGEGGFGRVYKGRVEKSGQVMKSIFQCMNFFLAFLR